VYRHDPQAVAALIDHKEPHPLLCGRTGIIDRFPDHMHEGCVIEDEDVQLVVPLDIPGYDGEEFPVVTPVFERAAAFTTETFGVRPRPHVIAHGLTTNRDGPVRRFGLIGVYDGDPAGIGRVVVESTWHHWFSMNLFGFQAQDPALYARIQNYYRNVAFWLSTPEQRAGMLVAATWGVLVGKQPEAFDKVMGIWDLGKRVMDAIGHIAPQCIVSEMVTTLLRSRGSPGVPRPPSSQERRHAQLELPSPTMSQAIVGGIALELVDLAHHHINERARGRSVAMDADAIRRKGLEGVTAGVRELIDTLRERSSQLASLSARLHDTIEHRNIGHIRICEAIVESGR
jgi:hypothetical protein